jgi:hypothetical protein
MRNNSNSKEQQAPAVDPRQTAFPWAPEPPNPFAPQESDLVPPWVAVAPKRRNPRGGVCS